MNDDHICSLILSRNQDGLSLLLDKYGGLMKYIAGNIGDFNDEDLAECISDSLLAIWNRISNYNKDKASFKSWVVLVTRGCTIDYLRKAGKHRNILHLEDVGEELSVSESFDYLDADSMCKILNRLPPPYNDIFFRRFILGESISVISKALDASTESIYKRIARGREKLRALLAEEGYYV